MPIAAERPKWEELREAFARYAQGRAELLEALGIESSNRDPLAEFSERIVAALLGGELASNRVQRGWDVMADGHHVQVKYLANPGNEVWVNEHHIVVTADMDDYAIVFFEALLPVFHLHSSRAHAGRSRRRRWRRSPSTPSCATNELRRRRCFRSRGNALESCPSLPHRCST
jgi:hypothetical protein